MSASVRVAGRAEIKSGTQRHIFRLGKQSCAEQQIAAVIGRQEEITHDGEDVLVRCVDRITRPDQHIGGRQAFAMQLCGVSLAVDRERGAEAVVGFCFGSSGVDRGIG